MTVHLHYDLATKPGMMFDEVFPGDAVEKRKASRFDSVPYDGQQRQAVVPGPAPVSPCYSKGSSSSSAANSITGESSDMEYKYHVDPRVLGSGHHGSVRECVDRVTGQRYAVKSVRKSDPAIQPRGLVREIDLLREMKHKDIIRLIDVFEDAEYVHIITDLCGGGELFDKIVEKSSDEGNGGACFAEDEAARIIYQVLTAVSYMHRRGVVHRDLKPENILLSEDDEVKIADFGLAAMIAEHERAYANDAGGSYLRHTAVGSLMYAAPEVVICGSALDNGSGYSAEKADVWSLGVMLYAMLTGTLPFKLAHELKCARYAAMLRFGFATLAIQFSLQISPDGINLLAAMLDPTPERRASVAQVLSSPWLAHLHCTAQPQAQPQVAASDKWSALLTRNCIDEPQSELAPAEVVAPSTPVPDASTQETAGMLKRKAAVARLEESASTEPETPTTTNHEAPPRQRRNSRESVADSEYAGTEATAPAACGEADGVERLTELEGDSAADGVNSLLTRTLGWVAMPFEKERMIGEVTTALDKLGVKYAVTRGEFNDVVEVCDTPNDDLAGDGYLEGHLTVQVQLQIQTKRAASVPESSLHFARRGGGFLQFHTFYRAMREELKGINRWTKSTGCYELGLAERLATA